MSTSLHNRPHFSHSALRQLQTCSLQYRLQRIDGVKASHRNPALVLGSTYHSVLAHALTALKNGQVLSDDELVAYFDQVWKVEVGIEAPPIRWTARTTEESEAELGRAMVLAWHEQALPIFCDADEIIGIEQRFRIPILHSKGEVLETPLDGFIDCIFRVTNGDITVVDHKTAAQSYKGAQVDMDMQATAYLYAAQQLGIDDCRFAFHVMSKAKKGPKLTVCEVRRTESDFNRLYWIASQAERQLDAQLFLPTAPGWQCDSCSYLSACKEAHVDAAVPVTV
jgi:RecB family exonuclease